MASFFITRNRKKLIVIMLLIGLIAFLAWRLLRPLNIFVVDDRFAWPVDTSRVPAVLGDLSAESCAGCHPDFYGEWRTTIHSQAWTDPYFQADWQFDGEQHSCRLCHMPLDRQLPHKVLGYGDAEKWQPILAENPHFDPALQHQGVTCAACHYREGRIVGVLGDTQAPHPVQKLDDPNQVCVRCHLVEGDRWDTFFRFPPCGTVAEINATRCQGSGSGEPECPNTTEASKSGETRIAAVASLGCVQCHMPLLQRALVEGGQVRQSRQHLWRGGHDPEMVKRALTVNLVEKQPHAKGKHSFLLTLTNTGAAHYLPTGTPDRHLTVQLRSLDQQGELIEEQGHTLKRRVMWRPFIVDLWDNRLPRWQPRHFQIDIADNSKAVAVEAVVRYHLMDEDRRKRIGYNNEEPIAYEVFRERLAFNRQAGEGGK